MLPLSLSTCPHPLLDIAAIVTRFPRPVGECITPPSVGEWLVPRDDAPLQADDAVRVRVRELLRRSGFKPSGRSKPASEYLRGAAEWGSLPQINAVVDACNVASLHSGLPISVVDLDRTTPPVRIDIAAPGTRYVFNLAGQAIDVGNLICLFDAEGPCANPVKDAQRTKTDASTQRTLTIVWGTTALPNRAAQTAAWYVSLLEPIAASTTRVETYEQS